MSTWFSTAVVCSILVLSGCMLPDQSPYSHHYFYKDAVIHREPQTWSNSVIVTVARGDQIVVMIKEGVYGGRYSTAHGSFEAILLQIPADVETGQTVRCTPDDGTLSFGGFGYDSFSYRDPATPAEAIVSIQNVTPYSLYAHVDLQLTVRYERGPSHPLTINKDIEFDRKHEPYPDFFDHVAVVQRN